MNNTSDSPKGLAKLWLWLLGLVLAAAGLFFVIGGGKLISLGGSWYFLLAGIGFLLSAIQMVRAKPSGAWLYLLTFVATIIWALADVGMDYWGLVSRLLALTFLAAVVVATMPILFKANRRTVKASVPFTGAALLLIAGGWGAASMFQIHPEVASTTPAAKRVPVTPETEQKDWDHVGGDTHSTRFAALDQITPENVNELQVAWTYRHGDIPKSTGAGSEDQLTPLQVGDKVFICTPHNNVIALDADTGKEVWRHDINASVGGIWERCRGLAYFDAMEPLPEQLPGIAPITPVALAENDSCKRRILMNSIDAKLYAFNADNGELCESFGEHGVVDLKANMGKIANPAYYTLTSAPTVAGTTIVIGSRVADNVQVDMPGGAIRGFDVLTGALRWAFDTGSATPNKVLAADETYTRSTANVWAGTTYDPASNTVFLPLGSPSVDLYGVPRTEFDHKYGASVLALNANDGHERWVFQTVHNDLWDFDLPMPPTLVDFPEANGENKPALVIGTKAGQIYVLNRLTGEPLTEVQEVPVKAGPIEGEPYSPTQPKSVGMPEIGAQTLTEADMWGATPFDQLMCRIGFKSMRYEGLYTAPGTDLSLSFPGSLGGMNWGGISADPNNNLIFLNDMRLGLWIRMVPQEAKAKLSDGGEAPNTGMGQVPLGGTPYAVIKDRFMSPLGIPCQRPPFGTLTAVDLKTQKIAWQVPVGTVQDTGPFGIRMKAPIPVGLPTLGSTLATQGGLVFFAGTQDFYLRAWDAANGKEVWKERLPVGSQGGPISYKSPKTGRQYVVISAGGARQSPDRGDYVIAYALPEKK